MRYYEDKEYFKFPAILKFMKRWNYKDRTSIYSSYKQPLFFFINAQVINSCNFFFFQFLLKVKSADGIIRPPLKRFFDKKQ